MARKPIKIDSTRVSATAGFFSGFDETTEKPEPKTVKKKETAIQTAKEEKKPEKEPEIKQKEQQYKDTVSPYGNKIGRPRKEKKAMQFTLTCDADYHKMISEIAEKQGKSNSAFIRDAIDHYIKSKHLS